MPSFSASTRFAAAIAILAIGANAGIASASAKTPVHAGKHAARAANASDPTTSAGTPQPAGIPGDWNLVLDSAFNGSSLDTKIWRAGWFGTGVTDSPGNGGICQSSNNVTFPGDGTVHLNVTATPSTCQRGQSYRYTGALIDSDPHDGRSGGGFQYTYGVAEARIFIPANGNQIAGWPAFWGDGQTWPNDGEDDVMEGLAGEACFHFHDPLGGPGSCDTTLTPGWHTFASDWQPGSVTYYYDGSKVGSITTGITNSPMYLILSNGDAVGATNMKADSMKVQYVRVWQS